MGANSLPALAGASPLRNPICAGCFKAMRTHAHQILVRLGIILQKWERPLISQVLLDSPGSNSQGLGRAGFSLPCKRETGPNRWNCVMGRK